jgi:P-type E1-E2 ATPase
MLAVKETEAALAQRLTRVTLQKEGEQTQDIDPSQLKKGEIVRVLAGGQIPVDGRIIRGRAWIDESVTSGEQIPVMKQKGNDVLAGSLVVDATLDIRAATDARTSGLHQLREDVRRALEERGRLAHMAERASRVLVLVTVVLGAATFAYWLGVTGWSHATLTALSVFLVACPCSLGIAVPLVVYFGLNRARQQGALFRSGDSLERAAAIDRIAFDRTGTLTGRAPRFAGVQWFDRDSADRHAVWTSVVTHCGLDPLPTWNTKASLSRMRLKEVLDQTMVPPWLVWAIT